MNRKREKKAYLTTIKLSRNVIYKYEAYRLKIRINVRDFNHG